MLEVYSDRRYHFFNCNKCKKKYSIRGNTFLSNANISLRKMILLIYIFVFILWNYRTIMRETDLSSDSDDSDDKASSVLSTKTISKYYTYFRYYCCRPVTFHFMIVLVCQGCDWCGKIKQFGVPKQQQNFFILIDSKIL